MPALGARRDEAWNSSVAEIGHAFRVTVRATNGYVYPASHRAGSTAGALPMGARLRLKASVNGLDPALRTSDPNVRKIFRAMVIGGSGSNGTVTLTAAAPAGGAAVALSSASGSVQVPASVMVAPASMQAPFAIATTHTARDRVVTISASYGSVKKNAPLTVAH